MSDEDGSTFDQSKDKLKLASADPSSAIPARTTFANLPYEILLQILRYVQNGSPEHLNQCLVVNRRWCNAALELIWYKPTFHTPRAFDRMVAVLAQASGGHLSSQIETALATLHVEDQSGLESPSSAAATAGGGGLSLASVPAGLHALSSRAVHAEEFVVPMVSSGQANPLPLARSLDMVSSSSSSSISSASVSTTSLCLHAGESLLPQVMFPYNEYVRRINCTPIGKDLVGARADVFAVLAGCTQLERLTLAGAKNLPDAVLRAVLPQCTTLVAVDLTDVAELTDETLAAIAQACPRLQGINVTNCTRVSSKGIVPLALSCPLLRRVKLGNCVLVDDHAVVALARNCRHLLEIDLTGCTEVTDAGVSALWRHTHVLRELKLTGCLQLTSSGFPAHNAGLIRRSNILSNGIVLDNEREDDDLPESQQLLDEDDVSYESAVFSDPSALYPPYTPTRPSPAMSASSLAEASELALEPLGPLVHAPRPPRIFEQLRILDLGNCSLLTDPVVEGVINHAPKLRNLVLSKCSLLTDDSLYAISRLGKNLHYLHLGRCEKITDRAVKYLARNCTRLRYIDLAYCPELTDAAVQEIGLNLPKLRRIGLVKVQGLTDAALVSLVGRHTSLERIHLSYCDRLTVPGVFYAVLKLPKLTHLSLTGVPAFRKKELQAMCRPPPPEFNDHQRATFCVYSGRGVHSLRDHLSRLYMVWRRTSLLPPLPEAGGAHSPPRAWAEAVEACRLVSIAPPQDGERGEDAFARAARQAAVTLGLEHIRIPAARGMPSLPPARAPGPDLAESSTVALLMNLIRPPPEGTQVSPRMTNTTDESAAMRVAQAYRAGLLHEDEPRMGSSAHTHAQAQLALRLLGPLRPPREAGPSTPAPAPSRAAQWALDPELVARLDRVLRGERPARPQ